MVTVAVGRTMIVRGLVSAVVLPILMLLGLGCSTFIGTTATSFMRKVRESDDPNIRYIAYGKLGVPGCYDSDTQKDSAVTLLIEALEPGKEPIASRAMICRSLGELRRPEAHDALVKCVEDPDPTIRAEACRSLGKVGGAEDATVLAKIMTIDRQADCRIAAIDGIGELRSTDPKISSMLVANMEHNDPAVRLASLRALRKMSGKDLGVEPGPWRAYVDELARAQGQSPGRSQPGPEAATAGVTVPSGDSQARRVAAPR